MLTDEDAGFLPPADPPPDPPLKEKKPDTESTLPNFADFVNQPIGGSLGGVNLSNPIKTFIDDSSFDLGNPNSAASRFLKERETVINISVDPILDAEVKTQKQMDDFNSRLQVNNRFRVL